ncbi:uncharacterized protein LOC113351037 [Papaver somniferum]|uniref:uncharacterized protein LOC113351037 n=1 Tax=Papaver somniferum TaxID=3469 RepID=UPI000E6F5ACF|nr:uncharacterized protein LOC113351037 [Papaver somniferum]
MTPNPTTTTKTTISVDDSSSWTDIPFARLHGDISKKLNGNNLGPTDIPFVTSVSDTSLFIRRSAESVIFLLVYVDDIILTGSSMECIQSLMHTLHNEFSLKDLGSLSYFLGIEFTQLSNGLFLSQRRYIEDLLVRANMQGAKPVTTDLHPVDSPLLSDVTMYRSLVGGLQYLSMTRPDISFAVNKVCQFMHKPAEAHLIFVKRILRYLQHTSTFGIFLRPERDLQLSFSAYSDADWAGNHLDRRSTSGYCVYLGSNLISWSSRKQRTVS